MTAEDNSGNVLAVAAQDPAGQGITIEFASPLEATLASAEVTTADAVEFSDAGITDLPASVPITVLPATIIHVDQISDQEVDFTFDAGTEGIDIADPTGWTVHDTVLGDQIPLSVVAMGDNIVRATYALVLSHLDTYDITAAAPVTFINGNFFIGPTTGSIPS